jgi:iron(III) transport system ATP-binding protein
VDRPGDAAPAGTSIVVEGVELAYGQGAESVPVLHGVDLAVEAGERIALLGPSGCGKTTLLRVVAGLERPSSGVVSVGGRVVVGEGTWVPPERRRVGLVFQDGALFPHRTVAGNVGYGLGRRDPDRAERVAAALAMVGLDGLGDRTPDALSGGQQQRVALARALAPRPGALLLDEPFSDLDASLRVQVRTDVRDLLQRLGVTAVFVTHDQEEAFLVGDRVAVMSDGRIVQVATPEVLYTRPATAWVARFVGEANLLAGHADGGVASTPLGAVPLADAARGEVEVLVRPEAVALRPGGQASVESVDFLGHDTSYVVRLPTGEAVRVRVPAAPVAQVGDAVELAYAGPPTVAYVSRT